MGNDKTLRSLLLRLTRFQSTFPRGERQGKTGHFGAVSEFQSTFPRGERRWNHGFGWQICEYFNPRSRVGNDSQHLQLSPRQCHFNPRSRVGNDDKHITGKVFRVDFNPRSRVGNDVQLYLGRSWYGISIHVPAWGTTVMLPPFPVI